MSEPTAPRFDLVGSVAEQLAQLAERWKAGEFGRDDVLTLIAARKTLDAYAALNPDEFDDEPRPSEDD